MWPEPSGWVPLPLLSCLGRQRGRSRQEASRRKLGWAGAFGPYVPALAPSCVKRADRQWRLLCWPQGFPSLGLVLGTEKSQRCQHRVHPRAAFLGRKKLGLCCLAFGELGCRRNSACPSPSQARPGPLTWDRVPSLPLVLEFLCSSPQKVLGCGGGGIGEGA